MANIGKGDVVVLKSGGPDMTVDEIGDYSQGMGMGPTNGVHCVWFDGKKPMDKVFDAAVLKKV